MTRCSKAEGETEIIVFLRKEEVSAVSSPPNEKKRHFDFPRKSSAERRDERVTPLHLDLLRETEGRRRCCDTPYCGCRLIGGGGFDDLGRRWGWLRMPVGCDVAWRRERCGVGILMLLWLMLVAGACTCVV